MARLPRYALPGQPQHVIQRGNDRCAIFIGQADYAFFLACLARACGRHDCLVHAYVLMTNHVHLLMTPGRATGIGKVMQAVGVRFVRYFNDLHGRTGTLFEGRYRATPVDGERYLLTCYRYIECNPVRAGIVGRARDYRWSSHAANAYGRRDAIVTPHPAYLALGGDAESRWGSYRALCEADLDEGTLHTVREATHKRWALGDTRFCDQVEAHGRRARPLPRGGRRRHPRMGSDPNDGV